MIIQFTREIELEVVESIDEETDTLSTTTEVFLTDEQHEVDVFGDHPKHLDIQFGDGSCAYHVPKDYITIIKDNKQP